jgi:hypothetical protein
MQSDQHVETRMTIPSPCPRSRGTSARVTLHHNLFVGARQRTPLVYDFTGPPRDTTLDMRNNLVWNRGRGVGNR